MYIFYIPKDISLSKWNYIRNSKCELKLICRILCSIVLLTIYGIKLLPVFYEKYNPIPTRKGAENIESMLGKALRLKQFGVWFN